MAKKAGFYLLRVEMAKTDDIRQFIDEIITAGQCASGGGDYPQARAKAADTLAGLLKSAPKPAAAPKAKAKRR
jgi:hypothetical protein